MDYKKAVNHIGDCSVSSTLKLVSPFEGTNNIILSIFEKMMKTLPSGNFDYKEKEQEYNLTSTDASKGKWYQISITQKNDISIGFDVGYGQNEIDGYIDHFYNEIFDNFQISLMNLHIFDERLRVLIPSRSNHYRMFLDAMVGNSELSKLVAGRNVYSFEPDIIFSADESKSSICAIAFKGKSVKNEIDTGNYGESKLIEIQCGVARLKNFIEYESSNQLIQKHRELARSIILGPVTEHVLLPLYNLTKGE